MKLFIGGLLLLFTCASAVQAGTLTVRVVGTDGKPVSDAVISLRPQNGSAPAPRPQGRYEVKQFDTQFHPFVSVVPVSATVYFPNFDPFKHHVYSFSAAKTFELKLFAKDQTRSVLFDKVGVVAVGCNIHDNMSAFIYVTDTVWTAQTDANGQAVIPDVPAQAMTLSTWHPYLSVPGGVSNETLPASRADRVKTIQVRLRAPPGHHMNMGAY